MAVFDDASSLCLLMGIINNRKAGVYLGCNKITAQVDVTASEPTHSYNMQVMPSIYHKMLDLATRSSIRWQPRIHLCQNLVLQINSFERGLSALALLNNFRESGGFIEYCAKSTSISTLAVIIMKRSLLSIEFIKALTQIGDKLKNFSLMRIVAGSLYMSWVPGHSDGVSLAPPIQQQICIQLYDRLNKFHDDATFFHPFAVHDTLTDFRLLRQIEPHIFTLLNLRCSICNKNLLISFFVSFIAALRQRRYHPGSIILRDQVLNVDKLKSYVSSARLMWLFPITLL